MEGFNRESRQSIYFEVTYVLAHEWPSDTMERLEFQKLLTQNQLDFPQTTATASSFSLIRTEQSPLQVKMTSLGPRVSNISVSAKKPVDSLELFSKEAEAICDAYRQIWLKQPCQMLQCSARIQHLYSCREHAFKYLWEDRLGQDPEDFALLGKRPVLGGGLRLVMPPVKADSEPAHIEIKIESFFPELAKIFIETSFVWPKPRLITESERFEPESRLELVEKYAAGEVCDFLLRPREQA